MLMNNATGSRAWTPEQDAHLTKLWTEGASASEIAVEMNCGKSRMAVIGRAHRLKLPGRIEGRRVHQKARPAKIKREPSKGGRGFAFKLAEAKRQGLSVKEAMPLVLGRPPSPAGALPPERDDGVDVSHLIGIMDLGSTGYPTQCRWIHGEAGADAKFCGKPTGNGSPWCDEHKARVYKRAAAD